VRFNKKIESLAGRYSIYQCKYTFQESIKSYPQAEVKQAYDWVAFQSLLRDNYYNGVQTRGILYDKDARIM